MLNKLAIKLVYFLFKNREFTIEQKNKLSVLILNSLNALPLKESIEQNENGELVIRGDVVDVEKARKLTSSAISALENQSLRIIREQVAYEAIVNGVHKFNGDSGQLFMRAALWWEQESEKKLKFLAGQGSLDS
jgi:hypothetical protein